MEPSALLTDIGRHWLDDLRARWTENAQREVVFAYHGVMDFQEVQRLTEVAEQASLAHHDPVGQRKRLVNVLVEGLENVHHHAHGTHPEATCALLVRDGGGYRMALGNVVPLATAALITHRVGILNEMDDVDIKEHYMKLLANTARSDHGGAGLGLLTMARKSARPIVLHTSRLSATCAFLVMELRVPAPDPQAPEA